MQVLQNRSQTFTSSCKCQSVPYQVPPISGLKKRAFGTTPGPAIHPATFLGHWEQGKRRHLSGSASATPRASVMAAAAGSNPKVLVPLGNGSEEMEAVIVIDVLRRAGADVVVASVEDSLQVTCSRAVKLTADAMIADAAKDQYDLIVLPGGMPGAERLRDSAALEGLVKSQKEGGRLLAAICAAPAVVLEAKGMLAGQKATCHPGFSSKLSDQSAVESRVVVDGKLTTSRAPGTAFEFALSLVNQLYGREKMESVAGPMVMYPYSV
ncbi:class I glutamine amidotransferase-like protein [Dunaliella salina]|uniref:Class I glutamine amidotransferase-like protein n=1 Tax=Dunaliella salina TaxID=3046 RepID=A0ABQ7GZS8_DUNSA|nr:class I glutamine amidotransferase-like protein [Dunaliella salina]|eukprot:KAF5840118.1 class I glutamine amidotransferase-like protein [Dunaliella salina]